MIVLYCILYFQLKKSALAQFSDIIETTANNYIREAVNKYPAGATIAKFSSSGSLVGRQLEGVTILENQPKAKSTPQ